MKNSLTDMKPNRDNIVDEETFENILREHGIFIEDQLNHDAFPEAENGRDFVIYWGDLKTECMVPSGTNYLIVGDLKCQKFEGHDPTLNWEGSTIAVTGEVECDFFSNDFDQLIVIGGDLKVKTILDIERSGSHVEIFGSLNAQFFFSEEIEAEVHGTTAIEYGHYTAKHDLKASSKYIGFDLDGENPVEEIRKYKQQLETK